MRSAKWSAIQESKRKPKTSCDSSLRELRLTNLRLVNLGSEENACSLEIRSYAQFLRREHFRVSAFGLTFVRAPACAPTLAALRACVPALVGTGRVGTFTFFLLIFRDFRAPFIDMEPLLGATEIDSAAKIDDVATMARRATGSSLPKTRRLITFSFLCSR
jgi:hypothetical protein